ncbi:MAG: putative oxidoreductase [Labilithrix sp.]|nr:putative oxidoreductase [Labilithrix sp.]
MPHRLGVFETDLARAATLPAFAYTDPAILAAEQERIFRRSWEPVGNAVDVAQPGSFLTAEVAGAPIVVTRDASGELRGFYNVCRHRAGPVAIGKGTRKSLTCRYHGWTYALDGRLVTTPELGEVQDFDRSCHGLRPVRVETWGPLVFACLDHAAPPLLTILGAIPDETAAHELAAMKPVARREYEIACNWKVYVDNFLEGYHLPTVHPGLFRELDYARYRVETFAAYSSQIAPIRPALAGDGTKDRYYEPADGELAALYYWVFPGWMLNIYPDNMSLNVVLPRGPDRCVTVFEWFRKDPDAPGAAEAIARTIEFSHGIQLEDIGICEVVQRGLASGAYERGRFSTLRENGVHHFQSLVHAALTAP